MTGTLTLAVVFAMSTKLIVMEQQHPISMKQIVNAFAIWSPLPVLVQPNLMKLVVNAFVIWIPLSVPVQPTLMILNAHAFAIWIPVAVSVLHNLMKLIVNAFAIKSQQSVLMRNPILIKLIANATVSNVSILQVLLYQSGAMTFANTFVM
jgi:hypothetical protein